MVYNSNKNNNAEKYPNKKQQSRLAVTLKILKKNRSERLTGATAVPRFA